MCFVTPPDQGEERPDIEQSHPVDPSGRARLLLVGVLVAGLMVWSAWLAIRSRAWRTGLKALWRSTPLLTASYLLKLVAVILLVVCALPAVQVTSLIALAVLLASSTLAVMGRNRSED